MARVRNPLAQIQVFSLPHDRCCATRCECHRESVVVFTRYKGGTVPREEFRTIPATVTLLAGEEREVDARFWRAPQVIEALRQGRLVRVETRETAAPPPSAVVAASNPEEAVGGSRPEARLAPTRQGGTRSRARRAAKEE
jgi:hypothetical protein